MITLSPSVPSFPELSKDTAQHLNLENNLDFGTSTLVGEIWSSGVEQMPEAQAHRVYSALSAKESEDLIEEEEFDQSYGLSGAEWHNGMTVEEAKYIATAKMERLNRDLVFQSVDSVAGQVGIFAGQLLPQFVSPTNWAMSMVPVLSGSRQFRVWAQGLSALKRRLAQGGAAGFIGSAVTEPLAYAAENLEQHDYTMADSLLNVAVAGPLLGAGISAGGGKIKDIYQKAYPGERAHIDDLVEALNQILEDKMVNPVRARRTGETQVTKEVGVKEISSKEIKSIISLHMVELEKVATPDQLKALVRYSQQYSRVLNEKLRTDSALTGEDAVVIRELDTLLEKTRLQKDLTLYRSVHADLAFKNPAGEKINPEESIGLVLSDKAFQSTSVKPKVAEDWAGDVLMEIVVPKGTNGATVKGLTPREAEILLPRHTKLEVLEVSPITEGGKKWHIKARVLGKEAPKQEVQGLVEKEVAMTTLHLKNSSKKEARQGIQQSEKEIQALAEGIKDPGAKAEWDVMVKESSAEIEAFETLANMGVHCG